MVILNVSHFLNKEKTWGRTQGTMRPSYILFIS